VTLGVSNYQNFEIKNVNLYDTIHRQFIIENKSLNWTFDLKPGETKEFKYEIMTNRPGTFALPSALLTYSELNMTGILCPIILPQKYMVHAYKIFKKPDEPVIFKGNIRI